MATVNKNHNGFPVEGFNISSQKEPHKVGQILENVNILQTESKNKHDPKALPSIKHHGGFLQG